MKAQQQFDYLRATAEADWISALTPAFVLHAKLITYPEVWARPLWLAMNPPPVEDDPSSWAIWTNTELTRQASDAHWEAYYANTATTAELQRDLDHATAAALLGVNRTIADKAFSIANATTDKAYSLALATSTSASPSYGLGTLSLELAAQRTAGLAANSSGHTLGIEDAQLGFQQLETNSRGGYSSALATAQLARDTKLATNARDTAITEANYQASADQTFALAEEADWRGQTTIDNAVAWAKAMADANLWTAEESANVSGAQAIDTALTTTVSGQPHHLPWAQYLVAEAQAHKAWWGAQTDPASAAAAYVQWVKDENAAQQAYTNQLADDDKIKREGDQTLGVIGIDIAKQTYAVALATAAYARDFDEASARYDEITSLLTPTKAYLDNRAQNNHDSAVQAAQHVAEQAANIAAGMGSQDAQTQYDTEMATTAGWYASSTANDDTIYTALDALAVSTWYARLATDEHTATALWINAEVQQVQATAASDDWYAHAADGLLVTIADTRDSIANPYNEQEATSWVAALAALNTAHPSVWATYELAKLTHFRDEYLIPADAAQAMLDHETAQADAAEQDSEADDEQQSQDGSADNWSTGEQTDDDTTYASITANAGAVAAENSTHLPTLAAIPSPPKGSLPTLGWNLNLGSWTGSPLLGTTNPSPQSDAQNVVQHLSDEPADAGAPEGLTKSPETAAADSSVQPAESSDASLGMKTALAAINFINSTSDREREAIEKWRAIREHGVTISDAGLFALGMKEGFLQGVQDGLLGLAWSAVKFPFQAMSFIFQINPITREASKAILGRDIGADEQAKLDKFEAGVQDAIRNSPLVVVKLLVLKNEVEDFLGREGAPLIVAMLNGDDAYFESRIEHLSPLAIEVLTTARIILVELAHAGLDTLNARSFGNIVGQVLYEVVEDAAVAAVVGAAVVGSGGTTTPIAGAVGGAEVASKTARAVRLVERLSKIPGFNMPVIVRGLERVQEVIQWMRKYPLYGKAFDAFSQAKRAGLDDVDALVYARKHIDDLNGLDVADKARELESIDKLLGKPDGWGRAINATPDDYLRPKPSTLYHSNGYFYRTDAEGRLVEAAGDLRLSPAERNAYRQRLVGQSSGVLGDEGGHMIGTQFGGLGEGPLQLVAQAMQLNHGAGSKWAAMERKWVDALDEGNLVSVRIQVEWPPGAKRPDGFRVVYEVTDHRTRVTTEAREFFENE